jgi:hypothetical protein
VFPQLLQFHLAKARGQRATIKAIGLIDSALLRS